MCVVALWAPGLRLLGPLYCAGKIGCHWKTMLAWPEIQYRLESECGKTVSASPESESELESVGVGSDRSACGGAGLGAVAGGVSCPRVKRGAAAHTISRPRIRIASWAAGRGMSWSCIAATRIEFWRAKIDVNRNAGHRLSAQ